MDFRKANDSVKGNKFWDVLRRAGTGGKILAALKARYSFCSSCRSFYYNVVAFVRMDEGFVTDEFCCPVVIFLITEEAITVTEKGTRGVQFVQNRAKVFLLFTVVYR